MQAYHMRYFVYFNNQIEGNELGGTCSTCGGEERRIQGFGGLTWWKETTWMTQVQIGG